MVSGLPPIEEQEEYQRALDDISRSMGLRGENKLQPPSQPLPKEAGRHKSKSMADPPTQAELDARLDAVEARTDAKFERMLGEMRTANANVRGDIRELRAATAGKGTIIITAVALFAAIAAVLIGLSTLGWQGFATGMSAHDMAVQAAREALTAKH